MPPNREELALRASKALALKLEGKSYDDIAKELGVGKSTAFRDVAYARIVAQDETIDVGIEELVAQQFANTIHAGELESLYLEEVQSKDKLEARDIAEVNKIKVSAQKIHSFLTGENANKKGGEKRIQFEIVTSES